MDQLRGIQGDGTRAHEDFFKLWLECLLEDGIEEPTTFPSNPSKPPTVEEFLAMEDEVAKKTLDDLDDPTKTLDYLLGVQSQLVHAAFGANANTLDHCPSEASKDNVALATHQKETTTPKTDVNMTIQTLLARCQHPLPKEVLFDIHKGAKPLVQPPQPIPAPLTSPLNIQNTSQHQTMPGTPNPMFEIVIHLPSFQSSDPQPQAKALRPLKRRCQLPKPKSVPSKAQQASAKRRLASIMSDMPMGIKRSRMRAGSTPVKPPSRQVED